MFDALLEGNTVSSTPPPPPLPPPGTLGSGSELLAVSSSLRNLNLANNPQEQTVKATTTKVNGHFGNLFVSLFAYENAKHAKEMRQNSVKL